MAPRAAPGLKDKVHMKVFDKVSKQLLGVWVNGKITAIKHSKIGRSKDLVSRYVVEFEDNERTQFECGHDEVVELVAKFQERNNTVATQPLNPIEARFIVGSSKGDKRHDEGAAPSEEENTALKTASADGPTNVEEPSAGPGTKRNIEKPSLTKVKKRGRPPKKAHAVDTTIDSKSPHIGTDYDDEESTVSENTKRRINWQKGRQDWARPSKTKKEIDKVTVDTLAEAYVCMRKYGWAILRDLTTVFAPSARFTREQQNYINKSK